MILTLTEAVTLRQLHIVAASIATVTTSSPGVSIVQVGPQSYLVLATPEQILEATGMQTVAVAPIGG